MTEAHREIVRRIEAAWDSGRLEELDEYFAPRILGHAGVPWLPEGLDGWKRAHRHMKAAVPDRRVIIEDMVAEGDLVFVRCRLTGTNVNGLPWAGAPGNSGPIDMQWISLYRFRDGKVVETWAINEMLKLVEQIGAPPDLIARRMVRGGWPVLQ